MQKIEELISLLLLHKFLRPTFYSITAFGLCVLMGCTLAAVRPVQEMSFTAAALRSAKEVQADNLAPELYRQAVEWFFKAKKEYRLRNFHLAKEHAEKSRILAEQAEFESISNGGNREDASIKDPLENATAPGNAEPYAYPTPEPIPAEGVPPEGPPPAP